MCVVLGYHFPIFVVIEVYFWVHLSCLLLLFVFLGYDFQCFIFKLSYAWSFFTYYFFNNISNFDLHRLLFKIDILTHNYLFLLNTKDTFDPLKNKGLKQHKKYLSNI